LPDVVVLGVSLSAGRFPDRQKGSSGLEWCVDIAAGAGVQRTALTAGQRPIAQQKREVLVCRQLLTPECVHAGVTER
jgi:hypothetical protein